MTNTRYAFSLKPPATPSVPQFQPRDAYRHAEFLLDLPPPWRLLPGSPDNTQTFRSDPDNAEILVATDLHHLPDDQAQALAEHIVRSRLEGLQAASPGPVQVLQQAIRAHASGVALEMSYIAEAEGAPVHLYLGYVTARKVLSFAMVCPPGRREAAALFNATVPHFRPRLP